MMQVILNGDDFGRSTSINAAVILAHRQGVLTSTSLMVAGDAAAEAVTLAQENPELAVGLHLVVLAGRAVLPPRYIPHLVDEDGYFPTDAFRCGLSYFASNTFQQELTREMEAQFERFAATGLPLAHVDGHCHMHVHPTIFSRLVRLAEQYGAKGVRLPRDEFWPAWRFDPHRIPTKAAWSIVFGLLCRRCASRLRTSRLATTDRVYGLMQTGQMDEAYVIGLLRRLRVRTAEFYFHPSTLPEDEPLGPNPGDLATLLSPGLRQVIQERDLELATYPTLRR